MLLESRGASVVCLPTIEIVDPDSWEPCDAVIWKLAEYNSVCFTSKNAAEKFIQRLRITRPQAINTLGLRTIYAVGVKTKAALESAGLSAQALPQQHSAEELTRSLRGQDLKGKHFLFPKSNIARDVLPHELRSRGAIVDEVIVYKTIVPETDNLERIRSFLGEGKINIVTFFSPSSVRNFVEMLGEEALAKSRIAVIGPTTAEAIGEFGINPAIVSKQPSTENLVQEIEDYFKTT